MSKAVLSVAEVLGMQLQQSGSGATPAAHPDTQELASSPCYHEWTAIKKCICGTIVGSSMSRPSFPPTISTISKHVSSGRPEWMIYSAVVEQAASNLSLATTIPLRYSSICWFGKVGVWAHKEASSSWTIGDKLAASVSRCYSDALRRFRPSRAATR